MGFYPYRTTDEELDATWDQPEAVDQVFLTLMRQTLTRWLDLAEQRLAGTGIRLYAMTGNDDPPELQQMLREAPVLTETEDNAARPGRGHPDDLLRLVQPDARGTPRGSWTTTRSSGASRRWRPRWTRPERAVFNLHVPPARTSIDKAPALDASLKPVVKGGAMVMQSVGSEGVRRVLERHQPMLGLHGHIHESRGAVRLGGRCPSTRAASTATASCAARCSNSTASAASGTTSCRPAEPAVRTSHTG